jgi:CBS domain-containing protein
MIHPRVRDVMTENAVQIEGDDPLATALRLVLSTGARHLLVTHEGQLVGVLSERDILRYAAEHGDGALAEPVRKAANMPAELVSPDDPLLDAAKRMTQRRIGCLPVVEEGRIAGILTVSGALSCFVDRAAAGRARLCARDIMSKHPIVVRAGDAVAVAADRMAANRVRHLPVIDRDGHICGILSDRDVRPISSMNALEARRVEEVMTKNVISLPPSATQDVLVDAFSRWNLSALPVVDERQRPIGMISYVDLLRSLST